MGAIAQSLPASKSRFSWFWEFLKSELAPYRGRTALMARMVTASTLVMIICMTFRIPYGAYAALFALNISRESVAGTANDARALVVGSALGGAYAILGAMLVLGNAMLRFLWVGATLFLVFYAISALSNYSAAARFAYLTVVTISLWDSHVSTESKVETTLWAVGAITLGSVMTFLMEIAFASFRRTNDLIEGITERLEGVEDLLACYLEDRPVDMAVESSIARLATVGTSRLRRVLQRSSMDPRHEQRMAALVALVGRLVDLAANLAQFTSRVAASDRERIRKLARNIAAVRTAVAVGAIPRLEEALGEGDAPAVLPLLGEIEKIVTMMSEIYTGSHPLSVYMPVPLEVRRPAISLVPGALANPEHHKFALRGCLAAGLCYIVYNALFWPGISTAVVTCQLTALTTIGASHQKQFLRFLGATVGGFVLGMGAQVFILPGIDSIGGFTVLFVIVSCIAAWFATASARLSYFGVQIAVGFYLINLQEFKIQTSLAVARDRVVGILLGLAMMWVAFDLLWSTPAGIEMRKAFVSAIRLLAQLAREPESADLQAAAGQTFALRERINAQFDKVRSLSDGVLFEFGPSRQQDLAFRERTRQWQPQLRTLFLMRIASLKYRFQVRGFELPEEIRAIQQRYDDQSARVLEEMADRIEGRPGPLTLTPEPFLQLLEERLQAYRPAELQPLTDQHFASFLTLLRGIDQLTTSLAHQIAADSRT